MTGAMYAGVAGLRTHMSALNVIGNNVANVNTDAYKSKRYVFSEALYTSVHSGSDGTEILGGRNPAQIGYGVSMGSIDLDMSTKSFHPTGLLMDNMIDGDGFYIVGDKSHESGITTQDQLQGMNLSRLGNFQFVNGYLVDGSGKVVYGFVDTLQAPPENGGGSAEHVPLKVLTAVRLPKVIEFKGNDGKMVTSIMYPQLGENGRTVAEPTLEQAQAMLTRDAGIAGVTAPTLTQADLDNAKYVRLEDLSIEPNGRIVGTTDDDKQVVVGYVALAKVDNPNGVTHVDGHYYQALPGAGTVSLCSPGGAVQYDAKAQDQESSPATTAGVEARKYTSEISITQAGDTTLINGGLEMPGTDLATEISNMICVQRGYQANTRIVTVTDSMLEELVNMKR